jgi:hypothetical protein
MGSPAGLFLRNTIFITVDFSNPCTFDSAIDNLLVLIRFFELLVGRKQSVIRLIVDTTKATDKRPLEVYWSLRPSRGATSEGWRKPHPADILLDAVRDRPEFCSVLARWLARHESWQEPRLRFSYSFAERGYEIDRVVAAANMFDILPSPAVSGTVTLSSELLRARETCRGIFKALPPSPERDSVLSALGRIGTASLKRKIRHRNLVIDGKTELFPELSLVTDEAVNCRNHYVHGSNAAFDYADNFRLFAFFINALEFVFAASDLIECGWNIGTWSRRGTTGSHPFGAFRAEYLQNLDLLKKALSTA